jgi:hypothetical protein
VKQLTWAAGRELSLEQAVEAALDPRLTAEPTVSEVAAVAPPAPRSVAVDAAARTT